MAVAMIGCVDSEGGPLLVGEVRLVRQWRGVEDEGGDGDYARACEFFDAHPEAQGGKLSLGEGHVIVWEMAGAGTAFVFRVADEELVVVRVWLHDLNRLDEAVSKLAVSPAGIVAGVGTLRVETGQVGILWSAEDGSGLPARPTARSGAAHELAGARTSAVVVQMPPGTYEVRHEETKTGAGDGRRLRMRLLNRDV